MEECNYDLNKRPLSLPSLINSDPTSPVASCCTCSYLSKSTGDIFCRNSEKSFFSGKRKWSGGPKLLWSVFKRRDSSKNNLFEKKQSTYSDAGFGGKNYLKPTSWTFVQDSNRQNTTSMNPHIVTKEPISAASESNNTQHQNRQRIKIGTHEEGSFVITPTYESFTLFGKKQKLQQQMVQNSSENAKKSTTISQPSSDKDELRIQLLQKSVVWNQKHLVTGGKLFKSKKKFS